MPDQHHPASADSPHDQHVVEKLGYEARDILGRRRSIFYYAAVHLGGLVVMGAIVVGIYMFMLNQAPKYQGVSAAGTPVKSSAAKVQAQPGTDMKTFKVETDRRVHGYGWVDESRGIVYVPIDKAIEMTANEDLPHRHEENQ